MTRKFTEFEIAIMEGGNSLPEPSLKNLQYLLESTFTTKFNNISQEEIAQFAFVYLCVLSATAQDHKFRPNSRKLAQNLYSTGRFENFRASADDLYNAVAVLGTDTVARQFNKVVVSNRLPELVTLMLRDILSADYDIRKAERHLMSIQRALKLVGDTALSDFRRNCQWWLHLEDPQRKLLLQRIEIYIVNHFSTSSAVNYVKSVLSYYQSIQTN